MKSPSKVMHACKVLDQGKFIFLESIPTYCGEHTWSFTKGHSDAEKYGNLYPVTIVHWVEIYVCSMWDQNSISKAFGKGWISHLEYVLK